MVFDFKPKQYLIALGVVTLIFVVSFGSYLVFVVLNERQAAYYPGSAEVSSQDVVKLSPYLYYRYNKVYRTGDSFRTVFHWYSNEFGLGPQPQGQSNCSSISRTEMFFGIVQVMNVTLCDSANGRLIFTERSWKVELP